MKLYRLFITLILLLCTNVLLGQRKEVMPISLDEIKGFIQQEVRYNNEEIPFIRLVTLYKKSKCEYSFDKISLERTKNRSIF